MTPENRTPKLIIVLGTNGTGKTTFVKKNIVIPALQRGEKVLVVVPDDMEWASIPFINPRLGVGRIGQYKGARKVIYYDGLIEVLRNQFSDGTIIFDDCRSYFTAQTDIDLHGLLIRRRQMMTDIVAVGHGFTEVPPKFFTFSTHLVLFKTLDNIYKRRNEIRDIDSVSAIQAEVNRQSEKQKYHYRIIKTM